MSNTIAMPIYKRLTISPIDKGHLKTLNDMGQIKMQSVPLARDVALAIWHKIKEVTGLYASAGISYKKFLAKLASYHRKPNGQYVITPETGPAFVEFNFRFNRKAPLHTQSPRRRLTAGTAAP